MTKPTKDKPTREQTLQSVDALIEANKEYVDLLYKLKIGLDQHFDRLDKEKRNGVQK